MSSICLSLTPILRCQALSSLESGVLLIPPALEIIFCLGLFIVKSPSSGKHSLLASEGLVYFALALLDLLSHLVTAVRESLHVFKALDIFIGSTSCVPLALYTVYLITFTTSEILPSLPKRFHRVANYTLYFCVPLIVLFNTLGSFVGLTFRVFHESMGYDTIAVRFTNGTATVFFNSLSLVLLAIFQALTFLVCFYRLIRAMINQRRIDNTANGNENEVHLFNGMAWITLGLKLGAIETVIGFAAGGFGEALTRRILRFLARATLIIGVMKGVDSVEDFRMFSQRDMQPKRRSALRALISNPRNSTFRHLGGHGFLPPSEDPSISADFLVIDLSMIDSEKGDVTIIPKPFPALSPGSFTSFSQREQRVTVRFDRNTQPVLELKRISGLSIPSPLIYHSEKGSIASFGQDEKRQTPPRFIPFLLRPLTASFSSTRSSTPLGRSQVRHTIGDLAFARNARKSSMVLPRQTMMSRFSTTSDNLEEVQFLSKRFSALPPRIFSKEQAQQVTEGRVEQDKNFSTRVMSQPPVDLPNTSNGGLMRRGSSVKRKPVPRDSTVESERNFLRVPSTVPSERTSEDRPPDITSPPHSAVRHTLSIPTRSDDTHSSDPGLSRASSYRHTITANASDTSHQGSHLDIAHNTERTSDVFREGHAVLDDAWKSVGFVRIKSMGRAPERRTPTPNHSLMNRDSVVVEWYENSESLHDVIEETASPGLSIMSTTYQNNTPHTISSFEG